MSTEIFLGVNARNHDASIALTSGPDILFAGHAERYSRIKNDNNINIDLINDCLSYGMPEAICWFEKPWLKFTRQFYSGETVNYYNVKDYLKDFGIKNLPIYTVKHHEAHAALGFFTSGFNDAVILVVDAIGEWNCTSIWQGKGTNLKKKFTLNYPNSMGLFYSAATKAIGLKPNEEEYILMGMAAYGQPIHSEQILKDLFVHWCPPNIVTKDNLHMGLNWYFDDKNWRKQDIAASVQFILENYMLETCKWIKKHFSNLNLVIVGGVALNCVANAKIRDANLFDNIWVPPNPGDGGLSLGAICAVSKKHIKFEHSYFGYNINQPLELDNIIDTLLKEKIVGIANGRAEFGPRALGNRSLLADPRGFDIKDKVNQVKKRDLFRPFAPVVLEEHKSIFYNTKHNQEYMQWTNICNQPNLYPAICHIDGTSRIQTVPKNNSNIRKILEEWYHKTGCPMLLNTSLNIKGQPLVNTWKEAEEFGQRYATRVY